MKKILTTIAAGVLCCFAACADTAPVFGTGTDSLNAYMTSNIVYPKAAIDNMIEGTVTLSLTVGADGRVSGVKVVRPLDPDLEAEAVRVVENMPAWTPATDASGKPVARQVEIPVKFRLPD